MIRPGTLLALAAVAVLVEAAPAAACVCGASPTLEAIAREVPIVVVGRVTGIGDLRYDDDPVYVDVDVQSVAKGDLSAQPIRIWNELAGTSCGGSLKAAALGTTVVIALDRVGDPSAERRETWDLLDFHPPAHDLLVAEGCGEPLRVLKGRREIARWLNSRLK